MKTNLNALICEQNEMKTTLKDKVVVITGSSRGIGRAIAQTCAQAGASVVISSRSQTDVSTFVEELGRAGFISKGFIADVSRDADVEHLFKKSVEEFGRHIRRLPHPAVHVARRDKRSR
jgi:NAD(P)-dependent dehydrogenase (short-subunit alcohol dehydrogenase family)